MARIRSMKPEMRTSLIVASWPREVRYFFSLMWGYLDDEGYGVDEARLIKADALPLDDDVTGETVDAWLDLIASSGPLCRYTTGGRRYIHAVNWGEHQKPQHPAKSKVRAVAPCPMHDLGQPAPPPHEPLMNPSGDAHDALIPEQGAGSREQGAGSARASDAGEELTSLTPAERIIVEAVGARPSEARAVAARLANERSGIRSLPALLRRMARDGDLADLLSEHRAALVRQATRDAMALARDGPDCVHGERGGANPHPTTGEPLCPKCRFAARLKAQPSPPEGATA